MKNTIDTAEVPELRNQKTSIDAALGEDNYSLSFQNEFWPEDNEAKMKRRLKKEKITFRKIIMKRKKPKNRNNNNFERRMTKIRKNDSKRIKKPHD